MTTLKNKPAVRVLLTGSNGLLGQKLVNLLSGEPGIELLATSRGQDRVRNSGLAYSYYSLDITDKKGVRRLVRELKPEAIIHTAAMTNADQCELNREACRRVNVDAVENLVETAKKQSCYFLYVSTDFVFSGEHGPYREEDSPDPVNYYGQSKFSAEEIVKDSGLDWSIVRTVLVYGVLPDMSRSNLVLWTLKNLREKKPIRVVNDQWRTPTLAEDLAIGCHLILKQKATGVFHISGEEMMTPYDMALKTADFFREDKSLITSTNVHEFKENAKRPPKTGFIVDKARNTLGFRPRTFEEGVSILAGQLSTIGR